MRRNALSWLQEACLLLTVEANDHDSNRQYDSREQRKELAKILRRFVDAATRDTEDFKRDRPKLGPLVNLSQQARDRALNTEQ